MILSISSFLSALAMGNILVLILYIFYRFTKNVYKIHYSIILFFSIAIILRLLVPLELPFTKTIPVAIIFPLVYDFLNQTIVIIKAFDLKVYTLFNIIWALGCLAMLVKYFYNYIYLLNILKNLQQNDIGENLINIIGKQEKIKIIQADLPNAPFSFGLTNRYIVISSEIKTEQELTYVLLHEIQHIKNRDLIIKFLLNIIRSIYWWNPIFYLIYARIDYLLELRVDSIISEHWDDEERYNYINCLCSIAKRNKSRIFREISTNFVTGHKATLLNRVKYFTATPPKISLIKCYVFLLLITYLSFGFVLEPYRTDHHQIQDTLSSEELYKNAYIIKSNNTYELYIDNNFITTIENPYSNDFINIKIIDK